MRALRSGKDLLCGARAVWWREWSRAVQADRLAADYFQPDSPDAATWPVAALAPKQKKGEQGLGQEAARILREKRRAAKAPRLFRRGLSVVLLS